MSCPAENPVGLTEFALAISSGTVDTVADGLSRRCGPSADCNLDFPLLARLLPLLLLNVFEGSENAVSLYYVEETREAKQEADTNYCNPLVGTSRQLETALFTI